MELDYWIDDSLEDHLSRSPVGPLLEFGRISSDETNPLCHSAREATNRVPDEIIDDVRNDQEFQALYGHFESVQCESYAREWVVIRKLQQRIMQKRRRALADCAERPAPYNDAALVDLPICKDGLVPLSEFDVEDGVLVRNGRAFVVMLPTPSENSYYWITRALARDSVRRLVRVRLDPLIHGDAATFPRMIYRMLWWGPPLLWSDIVRIQEETFGRWAPGPLSHRSEFTDYAWVPRRDEQHLFLEEMPLRDDIGLSWSRYFHAIFSLESRMVTHLDGAIRLFSDGEWGHRSSGHVHRTGKVGVRRKVFRIDSPMPPDQVSDLGATFFVWNYDVSHFFGLRVPDRLRGHAPLSQYET